MSNVWLILLGITSFFIMSVVVIGFLGYLEGISSIEDNDDYT